MTLNELLSWTLESAHQLRDQKKAEPNHRQNRRRNKAARASRKRNRRVR